MPGLCGYHARCAKTSSAKVWATCGEPHTFGTPGATRGVGGLPVESTNSARAYQPRDRRGRATQIGTRDMWPYVSDISDGAAGEALVDRSTTGRDSADGTDGSLGGVARRSTGSDAADERLSLAKVRLCMFTVDACRLPASRSTSVRLWVLSERSATDTAPRCRPGVAHVRR